MIAMIMVMVINEGGTMRTSSILVKSLTKTFTRTKVADPVAFAPGGLFNKTQLFGDVENFVLYLILESYTIFPRILSKIFFSICLQAIIANIHIMVYLEIMKQLNIT